MYDWSSGRPFKRAKELLADNAAFSSHLKPTADDCNRARIDTDDAAFAALAAVHRERPGFGIEILDCERERLSYAKATPPADRDQGAVPNARRCASRALPHQALDLVSGQKIGVELPGSDIRAHPRNCHFRQHKRLSHLGGSDAAGGYPSLLGKERRTATQQSKSTTAVEVLRLAAQLHADPERRHALSSADYFMRAAVEAGLIDWEEHSQESLATAVDELLVDEALTLTDYYPQPRRPGEPLTANRLLNARDIRITLRGHEAIKTLGLLEPLGEATPPAPRRRRRRKFHHDAGARFGRWMLVSQLGAGGNGEVWQARDDETGELAALKILHAESTDDERYRRFRREVETLCSLGPEDAVLPLYDFDLPEELSDEQPAWYAMQLAINLRAALAGKPLVEKVRAARDLAVGLEGLLQRGTHHRDVKPENLYFHGARYLLGDLGLVRRPDDEQLTRENRLPGPYEYLPSEAFVRWDEADFEKVDVFCLAKTLWVLAVDERRPPQGRLNADDRYALARRLPDEPYVGELDQILERATADDAAARPTLARFAQELATWLDHRELRTGLVDEIKREEEVDAQVRRFVVAHARADREFGRSLLNLGPDDESAFGGVTNAELAASLVRLRDVSDISGTSDELNHEAPEWWSQLWPQPHLIEQVEGEEALIAELAPLLRALRGQPPAGIYLDRDQSEVEIAGLRLDPAAAYFLLRYSHERGYLDYNESLATGAVTLVEPRVTARANRVFSAPGPPTDPRLETWRIESDKRFARVSAEHTTSEQPQLFPHGAWEFAYALTGELPTLSLTELREALQRTETGVSGWPMWLVIPEAAPIPYEGTIEAWLGPGANLHAVTPSSSDYWRASPEGLLYLTRGYEDDDEHDGREPGQTLEIGIVIWRVAEALLHAHRFAAVLEGRDASVTFTARWGGLNGRRLATWAQPTRVPLSKGYTAHQLGVTATVTAKAAEIPDRLEELVRELTAPLFEIFDFFVAPAALYKEETEKILGRFRSTT